jgi:hypothetical protein
LFKFQNCSIFFSNFKIVQIYFLRKKKNKKRNEKPEINSKTRKNGKKKPRGKKPANRCVSGPAQRHAHASGAKFRPTNGRSIGNARIKSLVAISVYHTYNESRSIAANTNS